MGDEYQFNMSMGVDPHETHSDEPETNIEQYPLQQHGIPGPPRGMLSRLVFQPVPEEPTTDWQDSGEDVSEGEESSDVVTFVPDIEPGTPLVDHQYQMKTSLLQAVEEACRLDQMRRLDDLGWSLLD